MRRPEVQPTISYGQALLAALLTVIVGGGYWIATKDSNDQATKDKLDQVNATIVSEQKSRTEQIAGVTVYLSKIDGKMDGMSVNFNQLGSQVALIDQRLKTVEDDQKDARSTGRTFQDQINDIAGRLRVLESFTSPGRR